MNAAQILEFIKYLNLHKRDAGYMAQEYLHVTNSVIPFVPEGKVLDFTRDVDLCGTEYPYSIPMAGSWSMVQCTSPNYEGTTVQIIENLFVFDSTEVCSKFLSLLFSTQGQYIRNLGCLSLFWVGTEKLTSNSFTDTGKNNNRKISAFQCSRLEGITITNFLKFTIINEEKRPVTYFAVACTAHQETGFLGTASTDSKGKSILEQTYSLSTRNAHYLSTESMNKNN